ncbi:MAG: TetR family transcriptional regulator [Candidatus Flexifilum sp.]
MARKPADQSVNREDILFAAADVLQRHGYEATTMKDIAAAVNLTAASLYHHFRNKDALLLAVLEQGMAEILRRIAPIAEANQPAAERLRRMIHAHVAGVASNTAVGAAMVFEIHAVRTARPPGKKASPEDHAAYADYIRRRDAFFTLRDQFEAHFRRVVEDGVRTGEFRPVDVPIFVKIMLGAQNWVGVWYRPGRRLSGEAIADQIAETFLHALCLTEEPAGRTIVRDSGEMKDEAKDEMR